MAGENRQASEFIALANALQETPYRFGFLQTLRRLESLHPDKPRIGTSLRGKDDPVRLGQEPSMAFAPSTLAAFAPGRSGLPPRLEVFFFGLLGPNGPLPLHLTEYARDRLRNLDDPTFARFLDIFNHRMLSLFYRAWASAQPTVSFDRPQMDRFGDYVGSFFGLGMEALQGRDSVPDVAKRYYAGHLSCRSRHPGGLRSLLEDYFKVPVRIQEFVGHWLTLPNESRCRLGETTQTGMLGRNVIAGARIWEYQEKFRIEFGSLPLHDYERFLPGGDQLRRLVAWVRGYIGDELSWDLRLVLLKNEVPETKLGKTGQLGWTTWLKSKPFQDDAHDLTLNPFFAEATGG